MISGVLYLMLARNKKTTETINCKNLMNLRFGIWFVDLYNIWFNMESATRKPNPRFSEYKSHCNKDLHPQIAPHLTENLLEKPWKTSNGWWMGFRIAMDYDDPQLHLRSTIIYQVIPQLHLRSTIIYQVIIQYIPICLMLKRHIFHGEMFPKKTLGHTSFHWHLQLVIVD